MGNYLEFYKKQKHDELYCANTIFRFNDYIDSLEGNGKEFMKSMTKTQHMAAFIEKSQSKLNGDNEIGYFVNSVRKNNKGKSELIDDLSHVWCRIYKDNPEGNAVR